MDLISLVTAQPHEISNRAHHTKLIAGCRYILAETPCFLTIQTQR